MGDLIQNGLGICTLIPTEAKKVTNLNSTLAPFCGQCEWQARVPVETVAPYPAGKGTDLLPLSKFNRTQAHLWSLVSIDYGLLPLGRQLSLPLLPPATFS